MKNDVMTVEEMQLDEIMTLRKQVEQLERKTGTVSKAKYDKLSTALEQMRISFLNSQKDLQKMRDNYDKMEKMYHQASDKVKEQTKDSTQTAIINKLQSKLSRPTAGAPRKTDKTDEDIVAMKSSGMTIRQICDIVKRSPTTVVKILKDAKI